MGDKKNVLIVSAVYILFLVAALLSGEKCFHNQWCYGHLNSLINLGAILFLPLLPLFLFSLITYKMRDEVFRVWWHLARWWIPISMLLVLTMPEDNGAFMNINKGFTAVVMSILFAILSTVIVITAFVASRKKRK